MTLDNINDDDTSTRRTSLPPTQRILKFIIEKTIVSEQHPKTKFFIKSNFSILAERQRHNESNKNVCIHPLSEFSWWWGLLMTFVYATHYLLAYIRVAFVLRDKVLISYGIDEVLLFLDVIFLIDITKTFNMGYCKDKTKTIILEKRKIMIHYITGYFLFDLISSLPFEYVILRAFQERRDIFMIVQLKTFIKLIRFKTFLNCLENVIEKIYPRSRNNYLVLVNFFFMVHFSICIINIIPTYKINSGIREPLLCLERLGLAYDDFWDRYIDYGLFYTFSSLASSGNEGVRPMYTPEVILFIFFIFFWAMFRKFLIIFIMEQELSLNSTVNQNFEMMNQVKEYMRYKRIPLPIQKRLLEYYDYRFNKKYFNEITTMALLSEQLQAEIILHSCNNIIKSNVFHGLSKDDIGAIIGRLHYEVYLATDIVVKAGSVGDSMYFICTGSVAVYTATGKEICHLHDGDFFGESSLIMKDSKRISSVMALEVTEVYRLDRNDFKTLILTNPLLYNRIETVAAARTNKTTILEESNKKERKNIN